MGLTGKAYDLNTPYRGAIHRGVAGCSGRGQCSGPVPATRHIGCHLPYVADDIRRPGSQRREDTAPIGKGKPTVETDGGRASTGYPGAESNHCKKLVRPKAKRTVATLLVARDGLSQRRVCRLVTLDRNTLRYQSRRSDDPELRARMRGLPRPSDGMGALVSCAAMTGRVAGESQEGRADLSEERALAAPPDTEESYSGPPCGASVGPRARAM